MEQQKIQTQPYQWSRKKKIIVGGFVIFVLIGVIGTALDENKNTSSIQNQPVGVTPQATSAKEPTAKPELQFTPRYEANSNNLFLTNTSNFDWINCNLTITLIYKREPYQTTTAYNFTVNETKSFGTFQFRDKDFNSTEFNRPFGLEISCNNGYWKGSIE